MMTLKSARRWRDVLQRYPELRQLEKPLLPLLGELQNLRLQGLDGDELKVRMFLCIRERGLIADYDRLAAKIREIERNEKEAILCQ
ncbi:hypothetical protein WDZ92_04765 [Nostoc sp. NIES-2111]